MCLTACNPVRFVVDSIRLDVIRFSDWFKRPQILPICAKGTSGGVRIGEQGRNWNHLCSKKIEGAEIGQIQY